MVELLRLGSRIFATACAKPSAESTFTLCWAGAKAGQSFLELDPSMRNTPFTVDLISDTATRPTADMLRAMADAPLGDEQKREDPTTAAFEERVAALLGQEKALFVPSATLANQIALALHAGAGDEVLCHNTAHVYHYEGGATSLISRAQMMTLGGARGFFRGADVESALRVDDPHFPKSRVVVVENTSNGGGGGVWPEEYFSEIVEVCRTHRLALHIDGARLMNAAVAAGHSPSHWGSRADTVQVCFSKGLGCPFGAVLAMSEKQYEAARRWKQALGGALRQSGIITAAMQYALDHHVDKLADDHRRAQAFATELDKHDGVTVSPVETNLVFFDVARPEMRPTEFCAALMKKGIRMAPARDGRVRACFHLDVDDEALEYTIQSLRQVLS